MAQSIVNDPKSWGKKDQDDELKAKVITACYADVRRIFANEDNWTVTKKLLAEGATELFVNLKVKL